MTTLTNFAGLTLNQEFSLMRLRFQRTLAISVGVHLLFFTWLVIDRNLAPVDEPIVEITWLDQPMLPEPVVVEPVPIEPVVAEIKPVLSVKEKLAAQESDASQVREQLKALQPSTVADKMASMLPDASTLLLNTAQATMAPVTGRHLPTSLNRGPEKQHEAVALTRGPASSHKTAAVVAELPNQSSVTTTTVAKPDAGSTAVRNLGGATLKGLVADRQVLTHTMPAYPLWATTQAVEGLVTLYFLVMPDGQVKENVQVQKTAGYQDFDNNAVAAIRQWRFEPLAGSDAREQWGTITFRYRLKN